MNDTLSYLGRDPVYRSHHHHQLTFGLVYAFTEKFVLPLSHDEVVHGKGSLYAKAPGDEWQKLATLRALYAWMWALPGNPLLFMGAELAMPAEWSEAVPLPWHLLDDPRRQGLAAMFTEMNAQADAWPALWQRDQDPMGFQWLDADDDQHSLYAFLRWADEGFQAVAGAANFTPAPRPGYRIGVPWAGEWQVVLDTDEQRWGGSGYRGDVRTYAAADVPAQGQPCSLIFDVPPLAMVWLGAPRPD